MMMFDKNIYVTLLIKIIFLFMISTSAQAITNQFSARIDQPKISLNEHVQLFLHFKGNPPNSQPDLEPLRKDFIIAAVGQSRQTAIINGNISHDVEFTLNLAPKKTGRLIIPGIRWSTYKTHPIVVQVNQRKQFTNNNSHIRSTANKPHVFIEESISNPHPYTHAQTIYTLKIYSDINLFKSDLDIRGVDNFLWADLQ